MKNTVLVFDCSFSPRYRFGMSNLKDLRESADLTQAELAARIGTSQPQIRRLESGERELTAPWAKKLAPHLGVSAIDLIFPEGRKAERTMPIVGRVGASTDGAILQETDHGPFGEIKVPTGALGNEAVVEVGGHSMGLYAPDGSLILYQNRQDPPQEEMLGAVCVVGLPDGRTLVKRLLRGSRRGLFNLESVFGETLPDEKVSWAAEVMMVIHPRHARRLRM